ncbi:unnamed protein product [Arctogadus glacialis]
MSPSVLFLQLVEEPFSCPLQSSSFSLWRNPSHVPLSPLPSACLVRNPSHVPLSPLPSACGGTVLMVPFSPLLSACPPSLTAALRPAALGSPTGGGGVLSGHAPRLHTRAARGLLVTSGG